MNAIEWIRQFVAEVREGFTLEKTWAWLTESGGLRLIMLIVIIPLIVLAEHHHWFR